MTLAEIRRMPTDAKTFAIHESIFRSYHIVEKVKELLEANVPAGVILEIIEDLQSLQKSEIIEAKS